MGPLCCIWCTSMRTASCAVTAGLSYHSAPAAAAEAADGESAGRGEVGGRREQSRKWAAGRRWMLAIPMLKSMGQASQGQLCSAGAPADTSRPRAAPHLGPQPARLWRRAVTAAHCRSCAICSGPPGGAGGPAGGFGSALRRVEAAGRCDQALQTVSTTLCSNGLRGRAVPWCRASRQLLQRGEGLPAGVLPRCGAMRSTVQAVFGSNAGRKGLGGRRSRHHAGRRPG